MVKMYRTGQDRTRQLLTQEIRRVTGQTTIVTPPVQTGLTFVTTLFTFSALKKYPSGNVLTQREEIMNEVHCRLYMVKGS
jgi:hypothetical protein